MFKRIIASIIASVVVFGTIGTTTLAQDYIWNNETASYSIKVEPGWNKTVCKYSSGKETVHWYYGDPNGNLLNGWQKINGKWYAFYPNNKSDHSDDQGLWGIGWTGMGVETPYSMISGGTFALYELGTQKKEDASIWSFKNSGEMVTGWVQTEKWENGKTIYVWYYHDPASGKAVSGWHKIDEKWYYFSDFQYIDDGAGKYSGCVMQTGWVKDGNTWYYMNSSGAMVTGWQKVNGTWYFFKSNGAMAANEWCEGYWLNANGSWTYQPRGSWKQNSTGWWFGDTSDWYAKSSIQKIDNVYYTFNAAGYWVN